VRSRPRLAAALGVLVGAGLALLAAGRPWVTQRVSGVPGVLEVTASGGEAAPAVAALAAVAAAGAVVLLLAGHLVARLSGILVTLAGAGVVASALAVLADPRRAAAPAVPRATGRLGPLAEPASPSAWVAVAVVAGLVVVVAGAVAAVRGIGWPVPGRRFEPDAGGAGGAGPGGRGGPTSREGREDPVAAWDALSRGEDPTG
jgi:hypothetical protein